MTEKQDYEVVRTYDDFELRRYAPHVVAEVLVLRSFEDAGNTAFQTLFGYISGQNSTAGKVAMTAPVIQRESQEIAMTAPVQQRRAGTAGYAVAFVLPSSLTLATAPVPTNPDVQLHQRPATLAVARRYRGRWTRDSFEHHCTELRHDLEAVGLTPVGTPTWARFDPPYVPWFLRHNEVVQEVTEGPVSSSA